MNLWTTGSNYSTPSLVAMTDDDDESVFSSSSLSSSSSSSLHNTLCATDFDTVNVMRQQETSLYVKKDPLRRQPLHQQQHAAETVVAIEIDEICRNKMCEWSYQIVDFCQFRRESVDIAMNYLDRFLLTTSGTEALQDRNAYQLVSMTCLYSAIKIHERQALSPSVVSQLSRGVYSAQQIIDTEVVILHALEWKMHPPTALSFVRELLSAIPLLHDVYNITASTKERILEIAQKQTELAVSDYHFIETPMSTIAYCAIMNALECCCSCDDVPSDVTSMIRTQIASAVGISDLESTLIIETQMILWAVCPSSSSSSTSILPNHHHQHQGSLDYSTSTLGVDSEMNHCEEHRQQQQQQQQQKQQTRRMSLDESPRSTHVQAVNNHTGGQQHVMVIV